MKTYLITFDPRQGVLMRLLNEVSRRGIDFGDMIADRSGVLTLRIETTEKQEAQLLRAWRSTIDVVSAVLL